MRPCVLRRVVTPRSSECSRSRCTFGKAVHIGYHNDGSFNDGYRDVILPTPPYTNTSRELVYTDLYIDVVIREDYSVYTKDQDIFDRAALRYPIVEESRQKAFEVLDWLEEQARHWSGPFDIMPRHLPRTDWDILRPEEIQEAMDSAVQANKQAGS